MSSMVMRKICPVAEFTTSEDLVLPSGSSSHVKYDYANDLVYWIQNGNIHRGLSDDRSQFTSTKPCFSEEILQDGKLDVLALVHFSPEIPYSIRG